MPRMGKAADGTPRGLDAAVVRLVGRQLGREVEFHWCAVSRRAPGIACRRGAATWSSASRTRRGRRAKSPGASPTPAASSGWSSAARHGRPLARRPAGASGSASSPWGRWPSPRRTTRWSASRRGRSCSKGSRPVRSTPRSSTSELRRVVPARSPAARAAARRGIRSPASRRNMALGGAIPGTGSNARRDQPKRLAQLGEAGEVRKVYAGLGARFRPPFAEVARKAKVSKAR